MDKQENFKRLIEDKPRLLFGALGFLGALLYGVDLVMETRAKPSVSSSACHGFVMVVVDVGNRLKPVLHQDACPALKYGEKLVFIEMEDVYPPAYQWGSRKVFCREINFRVSAVRKTEWLLAGIQFRLDRGDLAWTLDGATKVRFPVTSMTSNAAFTELPQDAWEAVKHRPHVRDLLSFPEERREAEAQIRERFKALDDSMDVISVEIVPKEACQRDTEDPQP